MIDIHSHILPGVDDGARTMTDSVDMVRELASQGVTDIITTPHFIDETNFISSRTNNLVLLSDLRNRLAEAEINVNIYIGNEIYINDRISELIKNKTISSLADSKYLLVEIPLDEEYPSYFDFFQALISEGYHVVLAHPERYHIIQQDYTIAGDLQEIGVLFQCNAGSFVGKYGRTVQKLAQKFAKDKYIFALGSDGHRSGGRPYFTLALRKLKKFYSDKELQQILDKNPRRIIERK